MEKPNDVSVQPTVTNQYPTPPKRNWWKTGFLLALLAFIVLVGLINSGFFEAYQSKLNPTPIPISAVTLTPGTENWTTYRNEEYGFEFNYPNDYLVDDRYLKLLNENPVPNVDNYYCEVESFQSLRITRDPSYNTEAFEPGIYIHIINTTRDINEIIKDCILKEQALWERDKNYGDPKFLDASIDFQGPSLLSKETKNYNSFSVVKIRELRRPDDTNALYYFYNDKKLFMTFADSEEEEQADQIISTFTFLDQNQQIPTSAIDASDWKTYTSSNYNYSIMYPNNWNMIDWSYKRTDFMEWMFFGNKSKSISIGVKTLEPYLSLDDFMQNPQSTEGEVTSQDTSLLNNYKAIYTWERGLENYRRIYLEKKGFVYVIGVAVEQDETDPNYQKILSTFKFID